MQGSLPRLFPQMAQPLELERSLKKKPSSHNSFIIIERVEKGLILASMQK